jgi:ribonuclease D
LDPKYKIPEESVTINNVAKPAKNKFFELQQNSGGNKILIKPKTNKTFVRQAHPYDDLIKNMKLPIKEMFEEEFDEAKFLERTLQNVPLNFVDDEVGLKEMFGKLEGEKIIAVDLEHHSYHSYTGLVSLIQISNSKEDFLVDPIKLRESLQSPEFSLNRIFANEKVLKIFHGAESDIAWLQRDFDTFVVNMFDSFHAAKILNLPRMSLAFLLEQFCGVELDKKYQLADWRERPMPAEMIEYARKDTHYLVYLYFLLKRKLNENQFEQVIKKSNEQCLELFTPEPITDKSWRVALNRSNFALNGGQVNVMRRLFYWREWKAKELDVSPPALMPNSYLARIAQSRSIKSVKDLKEILRNVSDLMVKEFPALFEFLSSDESKESEFYRISCDNIEADIKSEADPVNSHVRFDEHETAKKAKIETVPRRVGKVSFMSQATTSSGASLFQSQSNTTNSSAVLLAGLVRESLHIVQPKEFITREKDAAEREEIEKASKAVEAAKEVQETVKAVVHGSNRVIEDLEIVAGGSNSTVLADKLRKSVQKKTLNPSPDVIHFDYSAAKEESNVKQETNIFDPYNTMKSEKKKAFIDATIAPETGPRLSATRMSGNRMASFTKKRK